MAIHHDVRTSRLKDFCRTWTVREVVAKNTDNNRAVVSSPAKYGAGELGKSLHIKKIGPYQAECSIKSRDLGSKKSPMSKNWDGLVLTLSRNIDCVAVLEGEWEEASKDIMKVQLMLFAFGVERVLQCRYHKVTTRLSTLWHDGMWHASD